jgi:hypothetical protein
MSRSGHVKAETRQAELPRRVWATGSELRGQNQQPDVLSEVDVAQVKMITCIKL